MFGFGFGFGFLVALLLFEFLLLFATKIPKYYSSSIGAQNPSARGNFVRLDRLGEFGFSLFMEQIESTKRRRAKIEPPLMLMK